MFLSGVWMDATQASQSTTGACLVYHSWSSTVLSKTRDILLKYTHISKTGLSFRWFLPFKTVLKGIWKEMKIKQLKKTLWRQEFLTVSALRPALLFLLGYILVRNNSPYLFLSSFREKCISPVAQVQVKCCSTWLRKEELQNKKIKSPFSPVSHSNKNHQDLLFNFQAEQ